MSDADRLSLHGRVDSQALLGEEVLVVQERAGWAQITLPRQPSSRDSGGYPGWLPTAQLAEWENPGDGPTAVVSRPTTTLCAAVGGTALIADVSFATRLPVAGPQEGQWLPVKVPASPGTGWVDARHVAVDPSGLPPAADVLAAAGLFRGLPYLWGGTSGLGLDCSGLVHLVFRRFGVTVPRDAHDQAAAGPPPVEPGETAAGDLLFFARPGSEIHHVGICAGDGRMLHAPESGRGIELERLSPQRLEHLVQAQRWA
ncbi:MAG: C40 family peptidase [bacterium]